MSAAVGMPARSPAATAPASMKSAMEDIHVIPLELGEHVLGEGKCGGGAGEFQDEKGSARPLIYRRHGRGRETIGYAGVGDERAARLLERTP